MDLLFFPESPGAPIANLVPVLFKDTDRPNLSPLSRPETSIVSPFPIVFCSVALVKSPSSNLNKYTTPLFPLLFAPPSLLPTAIKVASSLIAISDPKFSPLSKDKPTLVDDTAA